MEASGQFIAAAKHVLAVRDVPVRSDMRAPLRSLDAAEASALEHAIAPFLSDSRSPLQPQVHGTT
jgi:dihydrodipicolinate synthase/N-acetylneuraminate lyase